MYAGQSYLWGPLTGLLVVGVLALVLRWAYGSSPSPRPQASADGDFGLLRAVTTVPGAGEAMALRAVLGDAGIRSTMLAQPSGEAIVMVFATDLEKARQLAGLGHG